MSNHEVTGGDYHARLAAVANNLAIVLAQQGLKVAQEKAIEEAAHFDHDADYLIYEAVGILLSSDNPLLQEHGLAFLALEAEHSPNTELGNDIAYNAKYDARDEESREFAKRYFEISLMHFRFATQAEDFVPTVSFFADFNVVIARLNEEGFPELYARAVDEVALVAIHGANQYQPASETENDKEYDKSEIDETLRIVAEVLRNSNPDIAAQARALITTDLQKMLSNQEQLDNAVTDAFMAGNFTLAQEIMTNPDYDLITRLWKPMAARLKTEENVSEWGNDVIDTILTIKPDYFSEYSKTGDDEIDFSLGRPVGMIIGLLGRTDLIDMTIVPQEHENTAMMVAAGIAEGLGVRNNREGLAYLLEKTLHYTADVKEGIRYCFDDGLATK